VRVVFDTNIYIGAFVFPGGQAQRALERCIDGVDRLFISKPIIEETLRILADKFAQDREQLARTALFLDALCERVEPDETLSVLADEPDNRVLECALAAGAGAIVTGDKAMLDLEGHGGVRILPLRTYLDSE
jgi:putative PIN family toxin of toxin-antitoxin system